MKIRIDNDDPASVELALAQLGELLEREPENVQAHMVLGTLHVQRGEYDAAYPHLKQAVALAPDNTRAWSSLANCLYNLNHFEAAVIAGREAAARAPENTEILLQFGRLLSSNGQSDEALIATSRAVELAPGSARAYSSLGQLHRVRGEFGEAREAYLRALEINEREAVVYHDLAKMENSKEQAVELLARMETLKDDPALNVHERGTMLFAMAAMKQKVGDHDGAFEMYRQANEAGKTSSPRHWQEFDEQIDDTIAGFTPEVFERLKGVAGTDETPVFIIGMPRSGTTLVEQIVSSHPGVHAAGELPRLQKIAASFLGARFGPIRYPRDVGEIDQDIFPKLAEDYLAHLRMGAPADTVRITDKMPFNYLNLGLIAIMFPRATIIHCRRDPMDTCLSCYFQNFNRIGNIWFANDLGDLGRYYRNYERLMAHWREVLPLEILDVRYEELVASQEAVSRNLVAHAGLDWDGACLEFHRNARVVNTASSWQVRQPVYSSSIERWRRYEKHLAPLQRALAA